MKSSSSFPPARINSWHARVFDCIASGPEIDATPQDSDESGGNLIEDGALMLYNGSHMHRDTSGFSSAFLIVECCPADVFPRVYVHVQHILRQRQQQNFSDHGESINFMGVSLSVKRWSTFQAHY